MRTCCVRTGVVLVLMAVWVTCQDSQSGMGQQRFTRCPGKTPLYKKTIDVSHSRSTLACVNQCAESPSCQVAVTQPAASSRVVCSLVASVTSSPDCQNWLDNDNVTSYVKRNAFCGDFGSRENGNCSCPSFTAGANCEKTAKDCTDNTEDFKSKEGWGIIKPAKSKVAIETYCNFVEGIAVWLLRNKAASWAPISFKRGWEDYKWGFGFDHNKWAGLEYLYRFLKTDCYMMIFMWYAAPDYGNQNGADYFNVTMGDEKSGYLLNVTFSPHQNALVFHSGFSAEPRRFCTYDNDCNDCSKNNDNLAWWYGPNCEHAGAFGPMENLTWPGENQPNHLHFISMNLAKCT